jgi:hypothetical protein
MRTMILPLLFAGALMGASCRTAPAIIRISGPGAGADSKGEITVSAGELCAGRVTLNGGVAEVQDSCLTGDTDVVVYTDATSISPVRCSPHSGVLTVGGSSGDVIAYARMR